MKISRWLYPLALLALVALLLAGCDLFQDPIGKCPKPKLLFVIDEGQQVRPDPSGHFLGIIQQSWSNVGSPITLYVDNLKDQRMNMHYEVHDVSVDTLINRGQLPAPQGHLTVYRNQIGAEQDGVRATFWLLSECGASSTHRLELVP